MVTTLLFDTGKPQRTKSKIDVPQEIQEWGTFKDSLRAPVHSWFTYPAGFSYKAVQNGILKENITPGKSTIYDPFMGSGTTNLVAKTMGFNSIGVEAHPFVHRITESKFNWDVDIHAISEVIERLDQYFVSRKKRTDENILISRLKTVFPELILKCYLPETLEELRIIRDFLPHITIPKESAEFLRTALVCTLRDVSIAATGWPYVAPQKIKITGMSKKGWDTFKKRVFKMYSDLLDIQKTATPMSSTHRLILGDSRDTTGQIEDSTADYIFTSPPYLNNFDYADRTRLELYFMGEAQNWGDITENVRTKLMTSATTQINRSDVKYNFLEEFKKECLSEHAFLEKAVKALSELRLVKGGKKSYDLMVTGYFNDMYRIIKDNFRVLRPGCRALYILGDSAPYGVHIPTDELIGRIGVAIGFRHYTIRLLRERGGKWEKNPQRHDVDLRESIVTLEK
jgi:DNA modification methylase